MRQIDLHTHSTASDGTDTPADLVRRAHEAGLAALALTDHDTLSGLAEAAETARGLGLECIRGLELAVSSPYGEVHLLGLWLPEATPILDKALQGIRRKRSERNREIVAKLKTAGYDISYDDVLEVAKGESVGRPHIAAVLVNKGYAATLKEIFATLLGDNGPMYVPRSMPTPEEGLALLQAEGATTAMAHPMLLKSPHTWLKAFVGRLAALGLDALEAYHSDQDDAATRRCLALADQHSLALCGGSDYHGASKPAIRLGRGRGNIRVPYEILEKLLARRKTKGLPLPSTNR